MKTAAAMSAEIRASLAAGNVAPVLPDRPDAFTVNERAAADIVLDVLGLAPRPTLAETLAANSAPKAVRARREQREAGELSTRRDRAVAALRELAIATDHSARIANGTATDDDMRATLRMVCGIRARMIADVAIGDDRIFLYSQARDALALLAAVAS